MAGQPRRMEPRRGSELSLRGDDSAPGKDGSLFIWAVVILLLIGFAIACWIFSFYVFGHPEKPFSYSILTKLKKLDSPKRFELKLAPRGDYLNAQQLWDRYNKMSNRELERASEELMRNYLRNYKLSQDPVPYVVGNYTILDSYELTDKNVFTSGVVALVQSIDAPQVLLEQVFTADQKVIPTLQRMLLTGLDLRLDKNNEIAALINVKRLADGRLFFTAIPLLYASYASSTGPSSFSLEPPAKLNMEPGLPVVKNATLEEAEQKYASYRMRAGLPAANASGGDAPKRPQSPLVRVERPKPVEVEASVPEATPTPAPKTAKATPTPTPPAAVAAATPTPAQPTPPPAAIANTSGGNWTTYPPGQMPRGRLVNVSDMPSIASRGGVEGERTYLQGNFVVTAVGQSRAVLRPNQQTSGIRVLVEFPAGSQPPAEGSEFSRDSRRPFLIRGTRKGADGEVTVYAQEVTKAN